MAKTTLNIKGNNAVIEGDSDSFVAQLIKGCKGKVKVNTPFGNRELKIVKKHTVSKTK